MTYFIAHVAGGDPAKVYWRMHAGNRAPTMVQLEEIREERGLNDPLPIQFLRWVGDVARLKLGKTLYTKQNVIEELLSRLRYTFTLTVAAMSFAVLVAVPLGIISASKAGSLWDGLSRVIACSGIAIPQFWLALLLMYFLSFRLRLLPLLGSGTPMHLILPAITLGVAPAATITRLIRTNMLEVMTNEFVSTAYGKGLSKTRVVLKHIFRPSLIPTLTMIGLQFGFVFGGGVVVETVFSWPGIGKWAVDAIFHRDIPVLRVFILVMGCFFVMINLIVDLTYVYVDPRIRY